MVEASDHTAIHFFMLSVPAVHLDDNSLVTIGIGIHGRTAECLSPISGEALAMLWVKPMAERMGHHVSAITRSCQALARRRMPSMPPAASNIVCMASMMTILTC